MKNITIAFIATLSLIVTISSCSEEPGSSSCSGTQICSPQVGANETAATVPSSLYGIYETTYDFQQTGSPFDNGTMATFELTSSNTLIVTISGSTCYEIENPVFRFATTSGNYTFKDDCFNNVAFNVSENASGAFNEVNAEPLNSTGWFGQFAED